MKPYIILIEPQLSENVGMTARAMMNCGLGDLRLVNPRENHLSEKAISASSGAEEILHNAKTFATTSDAIADLEIVFATTARHRNQTKPIYSAEFAVKKINDFAKAGIMFGPERTGLHNEDVSLCNAIINIPLNPKHCSLNLSQAVLLVGYEYFKTQVEIVPERLETNNAQIADKEKIVHFMKFLEELVKDCKIFEKSEKSTLNLQNIFTRNPITEQELNSLYGVINYIAKK